MRKDTLSAWIKTTDRPVLPKAILHCTENFFDEREKQFCPRKKCTDNSTLLTKKRLIQRFFYNEVAIWRTSANGCILKFPQWHQNIY